MGGSGGRRRCCSREMIEEWRRGLELGCWITLESDIPWIRWQIKWRSKVGR